MSLFLPSGKTAQAFLPTLNQKLLNHSGPIDFFQTDERLDSSCNEFLNQVFINKPQNNFIRFPSKKSLCKKELINNTLSDYPDIILLSLADDGHFASIFEYDTSLLELKAKYFIAKSESHSLERLCISPSYINSSKYVFLFAPGHF